MLLLSWKWIFYPYLLLSWIFVNDFSKFWNFVPILPYFFFKSQIYPDITHSYFPYVGIVLFYFTFCSTYPNPQFCNICVVPQGIIGKIVSKFECKYNATMQWQSLVINFTTYEYDNFFLPTKIQYEIVWHGNVVWTNRKNIGIIFVRKRYTHISIIRN